MVQFTTIVFGQEPKVGGPGGCGSFTPSKKKESGTLSRSLLLHPRLRDEEFRMREPGLGGGEVAVQPVVNFLPGRLGECLLHPVHYFVHDIGMDVLEVVLRKTV